MAHPQTGQMTAQTVWRKVNELTGANIPDVEWADAMSLMTQALIKHANEIHN